MDNKCGSCSFCCTALGVVELNKKPNTRCVHQCSAGCAIYNDRPPSCAAFECLWLEGMFNTDDDIPPELMRPDKFGLMFHLMSGTKFVPPKQRLLCCTEVWAEAARSKNAVILLETLAAKRLVLIISANSRRFIGPPAECARVGQIIQRTLHRKALPLVPPSS